MYWPVASNRVAESAGVTADRSSADETKMNLNVPDDIVKRAEANELDLRMLLALQLYADNRIDHADAVRLSNLPEAVFNQELLARAMSIQQYPAAARRREAG